MKRSKKLFLNKYSPKYLPDCSKISALESQTLYDKFTFDTGENT